MAGNPCAVAQKEEKEFKDKLKLNRDTSSKFQNTLNALVGSLFKFINILLNVVS